MINIRLSFFFQSLALLACIALITFLPSLHFMPKEIIWFHDGQRLLEIIILNFVLLSSIFNTHNDEFFSAMDYKMRYAFVALILLAISSSLLAVSPRHAIIEISIFAGLLYLALMIARLYSRNKEVFIKRLVYVVWASMLLYLVSFYVGYITAVIFKKPLQWPLPFTGFSNIRAFNQYQLWSLGLITLPLLAFDLNNHIRRWLYIALIFWWVLLFYSASRGVLIAWLIGAAITAVIYRKFAWPLLRIHLINMLSGYFTYLFLFKITPKLNESTLVTGTVLRETTSDRIDLWHKAFTLAMDFPWLGVGPMHYAWNSTTNAHPHNSVLQLAAEFGIPATLIILTIAGYGIYFWLKKININQLTSDSKLDKNLAVILFFTITTNAIYSLVDGVIVMPISQVMMFTTIGLLLGHYAYNNKSNQKSDELHKTARFNFVAIFSFVTFVALAWTTLPEIVQGLSGNEKGFSTGQPAIGPRLWREIY